MYIEPITYRHNKKQRSPKLQLKPTWYRRSDENTFVFKMKTKASLYTNLSRFKHSLSLTRRKKFYIPYSFREDTGCSENAGSFLNQEAQLRGLQTFRAAKNKGLRRSNKSVKLRFK